jgi:cytochrome c oxidase cbb3-type subunit 3
MSAHEKNADPNHEEQDRVIHEIDGIQEYDNKLPNWWLYTLYGAILFAAVYWFHYHVAKFGEGPEALYKAEMDKVAAEQAAAARSSPVMTAEALMTLTKDKGTVEQGKQAFVATCASCHRNDGGGVVGPNLTDEFWLHGGAPEKVYASIKGGWADKGMPAWGPVLGSERTAAVAAYVLTLRATNVAGGKAPQGERESLTLRE